MDADHYDEFGNYIGPELDDTDSEEEIEEQESEMPLVPTGVEVEECFYDSHLLRIQATTNTPLLSNI